MIHLILTETALELVPKKKMQHPSVVQGIKRYRNAGKLLDSSLHHSLIGTMENSEKRGRPDILHHFLLDGLGSIANLQEKVKLYFHCSNDVYSVSSTLRCPRDTYRFKGLMVQLLNLGHIPKNPPFLIERHNFSLKDFLIKVINPKIIIKFSRTGTKNTLPNIMQKVVSEEQKLHQDVAILIGGFQGGTFSNESKSIPGNEYSLGEVGLNSWTVINRVLTLYELYSGLLD